MQTLHHKLDLLCKRIDDLHQGLSECNDPFLRYSLMDTIATLITQQSQLCKQINSIKQ